MYNANDFTQLFQHFALAFSSPQHCQRLSRLFGEDFV
jgi:hypothetical protein